MLDNIKKYWRVLIAGVFILIGGISVMVGDSEARDLRAQEKTLSNEVLVLKDELSESGLTEEDLTDEVEVIKKKGSHARDMGKEMSEVQVTLAKAYQSPNPVSDYKDQKGLDKARKAYTRMTESTDYINTWILNGEWTMELNSVGTYKDAENIPIVFTMYMKNGELAGFVRGSYNSEEDLVSDVLVDYTVKGFTDRADVGGA